MQATADNLAFAPPPEPAAFRGFTLAILAHLVLMAALTWGISWQKDQPLVAVEAELWSSVPEEAAPAPIPEPVKAPPVAQAPPVVEKTPPPKPVVQDPDIAIEREKKRREEAERRREIEEQKKLEARRKKEQQEAAERKERAEAQAKLEKDKAKREADAKKREVERRKNIERMLASAAGTGSPNAAGTAQRSKGPSATYAGRIAARIKPNIVFTDVVTGNPSAEVIIRVAPDGTIVSAKLLKTSGVKSWDDAVLRAIEKTERIPRDTDGTVVPEFPIGFRPKD